MATASGSAKRAFYFDSGAWLLETWNPDSDPPLEFENFNLGAMAVERMVIEAVAGASPGGEGLRPLVRRSYDGEHLRAIARLTVDAEGRIVEVTQPMFGTNIVFRLTDRETARQLQEPYQLVQGALVRAPYRIPASAMDGHIRYRFRFAPGMAFPVPETGEQRAASDGVAVTIDICAGCGPGLASDEESLAAARRATAWLQSDHPRLRDIGAPVGFLPITDAEKMELLRRTARPYLDEIDFAGHFSALEALDRGAGDCTESAVLLAALGRAAGIPTLVASGLVYSRASYHGVTNSFMPHSWTLAFVDGEWRSFDLALDTFDSTHIALTIGDGDARSIFAASQLASLLEWEAMTEVRPQPSE
ncbi:MAG: transglutaminase-like domain-containing protein [Sphingomonadales bacterium]|nr:transglutaminase-like domain-containing protein [Sphingomonadales bacterium]